MSKWKKLAKIAGIAVALGPLNFFAPTYLHMKYLDKKVYDKYTGHYKRQQKRLEEDQRKQDAFYVQEEQKAALEQRRDAIDRQRERTGVGSKYRTSTRNDNIRGATSRETLG